MAGLRPAVYNYKLIAIPGAYRQHGPVSLLDSVGPSTSKQFALLGITTIGDLIRIEEKLPNRLARIKQKNQRFLDECREDSTP